jgi:hypothetical protein
MLRRLKGVPPTVTKYSDTVSGSICSLCGWWLVTEIYDGNVEHYYGGFACLRSLDLADIETPVSEVKNYLLARYVSRFDIHPRLFEQTVASIFRDAGYSARLTAYSGDNGIDVFLDGPDDSLIGVQVKRWRGAIKVEQVHSLAGALIVNGCTKGVFVTTSEFQRGAKTNAERFEALVGIPIELVDAGRLYDALRITARRSIPRGSNPDAPWNRIERPELWVSWNN